MLQLSLQGTIVSHVTSESLTSLGTTTMPGTAAEGEASSSSIADQAINLQPDLEAACGQHTMPSLAREVTEPPFNRVQNFQ